MLSDSDLEELLSVLEEEQLSEESKSFDMEDDAQQVEWSREELGSFNALLSYSKETRQLRSRMPDNMLTLEYRDVSKVKHVNNHRRNAEGELKRNEAA